MFGTKKKTYKEEIKFLEALKSKTQSEYEKKERISNLKEEIKHIHQADARTKPSVKISRAIVGIGIKAGSAIGRGMLKFGTPEFMGGQSYAQPIKHKLKKRIQKDNTAEFMDWANNL
jgi:hypothetical protein